MLIQSPRLPFLEFLSWQVVNPYRLTEADMFASYKGGWRYRHLVDIPVDGDRDWRFECYKQLNIAPVDRSRTIDGIDLLALDFGLSLTSRMLAESRDVNQSEIQASKDICKKPRRDLGGL